MKVYELIAELLKFPMCQVELMILDQGNGGGCPRTVNLGPTTLEITSDHELGSADCEGKVGEIVLVIGFGCY